MLHEPLGFFFTCSGWIYFLIPAESVFGKLLSEIMIRCLSPWALIKWREMANLMRTRENSSHQTCCIRMHIKACKTSSVIPHSVCRFREKKELFTLPQLAIVSIWICIHLIPFKSVFIMILIKTQIVLPLSSCWSFFSISFLSFFFFARAGVAAFQIWHISFQRFDEIYWLWLSAPQWQNEAVGLDVCVRMCLFTVM